MARGGSLTWMHRMDRIGVALGDVPSVRMGVGCFRVDDGLVGCGDEGLGPRFRGDDGSRAGMMEGAGKTEGWWPFAGIAGWLVVEMRAWVPTPDQVEGRPFAGMTGWGGDDGGGGAGVWVGVGGPGLPSAVVFRGAGEGLAGYSVFVLVQAMGVIFGAAFRYVEVLRLLPGVEVGAISVFEGIHWRLWFRSCRLRLPPLGWCAGEGLAGGAVAVAVQAVGVSVGAALGLKEILRLPPGTEVGTVLVDEFVGFVAGCYRLR